MTRRDLVVAASLFCALGAGATGCSSCRRAPDPEITPTDGSVSPSSAVVPRTKSASDAAAPMPGMAFIPSGTLRVGTPPDKAPRVADEEPPGSPIEMSGFYIDLLPYPNEPGAIPTTNVTREEAAQLCAAKGKRLCTEVEWERACKGPGNTSYEYGDAYRAAACGTGVTSEEAARRPSGEFAQCKSAFGVSDMHGGVWEWTDSTWGRSAKDTSLAVLRGGNAAAGELVGRCANAIARAPQKRSPTMGSRCCAGPRNEAIVELTIGGAPRLEALKTPEALHDAWEPALRSVVGTDANHFARAWRWSPVANDELVMILACNKVGVPSCSIVVGRTREGTPTVIASADIGHAAALPDMMRLGDLRHLRVRGLDPAGTFGRDVTYVYGRVQVGQMNRP